MPIILNDLICIFFLWVESDPTQLLTLNWNFDFGKAFDKFSFNGSYICT